MARKVHRLESNPRGFWRDGWFRQHPKAKVGPHRSQSARSSGLTLDRRSVNSDAHSRGMRCAIDYRRQPPRDVTLLPTSPILTLLHAVAPNSHRHEDGCVDSISSPAALAQERVRFSASTCPNATLRQFHIGHHQANGSAQCEPELLVKDTTFRLSLSQSGKRHEKKQDCGKHPFHFSSKIEAAELLEIGRGVPCKGPRLACERG